MNVLSFITVLENGNEEEKEYAEKLLFHYENQLTHDGKPKPRKEDIFKKIKTEYLRIVNPLKGLKTDK